MAEPKRSSSFFGQNAEYGYGEPTRPEENSRVTPVMPLQPWTDDHRESQLEPLPPAVTVRPMRSIENVKHVAPPVHNQAPDAYSGEERKPGAWANNPFDGEPITLVRPRESNFGELNMEAFPLIRRANRQFASTGPVIVRNSDVQPFWSAEADQELESRPLPLKPPLWRRIFSKFLFTVIFSAVLALLVYEVALIYGITWADVQAFTGRLTRR
jgi:hypothetical protein